MLMRGSIRKGNNSTGAKTGPRTKTSSRSSTVNSTSNIGTFHKGLQNFHETGGVFNEAEGIDIVQNGGVTLPHEISVQENCERGGTGLPSMSNGLSPCPSGNFASMSAGLSVSMDSGSPGSPSRGSDIGMLSPEPNAGKLQQTGGLVDESGSPSLTGRKKKRGHRSVTGEKGGKGLRHFSMKVCEKVESKGRTTYNEVADELVAEFTNPNSILVSPDQQQYDEKNIRRRVYDALNVIMAMDIISKEKKEIKWKGLPSTSFSDIEQLKAERIRLRSRIEKKKLYLQELQDQIIGIERLVHRNESVFNSTGNHPAGGVALPFILVQTRPQATVEVEISEDMQVVHFDFNSTPFELHDDAYVLKAMRFCDRSHRDASDVVEWEDTEHFDPAVDEKSPLASVILQQRSHSPHPLNPGSIAPCSISGTTNKVPMSPPIPGILKARVKHETLM
ncbi:hypothetical protein O6H91_06G027800 [Diphasiastrum complanatum]|uniref:Uncharacterized protein n=1 Tax=Diphasiastrum complanatum TaxID=34168 RepID=A0ACC2DCB5_DIPCM|nr:hypothetical protein O6H91_06G027800 [Diphasiastrum complanatum]